MHPQVLVWDILSELKRDAYLLGVVRPRYLQRVPYLLARLSILAYLLTDAVFQVIPLHECTHLKAAQSALFVLAIATTYLLVFARVRGAFQNDWYITGLFGGLWVLLVVGASTMVYGTSLSLSSSTSPSPSPAIYTLCASALNPTIKPYVSAALLGPLLYLCLAYMFLSARLVVRVRMDLSMQFGVKEFVLGEFVPVFRRGLGEDGQGLYLIAVLVQLVSFIIFLSGGSASTPSQNGGPVPQTRFILLDTSLAITSIMACKVYRGTLYKEAKVNSNQRRKIHTVPLAGAKVLQSVSEIRVTKTVEQF